MKSFRHLCFKTVFGGRASAFTATVVVTTFAVTTSGFCCLRLAPLTHVKISERSTKGRGDSLYRDARKRWKRDKMINSGKYSRCSCNLISVVAAKLNQWGSNPAQQQYSMSTAAVAPVCLATTTIFQTFSRAVATSQQNSSIVQPVHVDSWSSVGCSSWRWQGYFHCCSETSLALHLVAASYMGEMRRLLQRGLVSGAPPSGKLCLCYFSWSMALRFLPWMHHLFQELYSINRINGLTLTQMLLIF